MSGVDAGEQDPNKDAHRSSLHRKQPSGSEPNFRHQSAPILSSSAGCDLTPGYESLASRQAELLSKPSAGPIIGEFCKSLNSAANITRRGRSGERKRRAGPPHKC